MHKRNVDLEAAKAAVLASDGLTQELISTRLGVSQATVSRLLRRAREEGVLVRTLSCDLTEEEILDLKELIYGQGLLQRLQNLQPRTREHLYSVKIFDTGHEARNDKQSYDNVLSMLGSHAAKHFAEQVLPKVDSMGIAWGATLRTLVTGLQNTTPPMPRREPRVQFVPVCGDPPEVHRHALRSSSTLVAQLDDCVNGASDNSFNFTGVAAVIPSGIKAREVAVIRRFFELIPGYQHVFGGEHPAIDAVDSILTSVGCGEAIGDPWGEAMADAVRLPHKKLTQMTFGNIGGVFLKRKGVNTSADAEALKEIDRRWTGIRETHFLRCARDAADGKRAGVVVLASGKKAEIVRECVRRGLVSQLLIDHELAAMLSRTIPK